MVGGVFRETKKSRHRPGGIDVQLIPLLQILQQQAPSQFVLPYTHMAKTNTNPLIRRSEGLQMMRNPFTASETERLKSYIIVL